MSPDDTVTLLHVPAAIQNQGDPPAGSAAVPSYQSDNPGSVPGRGYRIFCPPNFPDRPWAHLDPYTVGTGVVLLEVQQLGVLLTICVWCDGKIERSYTSARVWRTGAT